MEHHPIDEEEKVHADAEGSSAAGDAEMMVDTSTSDQQVPHAPTQPDSVVSPGHKSTAESPSRRESMPLPAADNGSSISEEPAVQGRDITAVPDSEPVPVSGAESAASDRLHGKNASHTNGSLGGSSEQTELDKIQLKYCSKILKSSKRLKDAPPFLQPVDPVKLGIPTYFDVVKHPMDISTVQNKLDRNQYANYAAFKHDLDLIFNNCYLFNGTESVVAKMGSSLQKYFTEKLQGLPTSVPTAAPIMKKPKPEVVRPKRETHMPARDLPQIPSAKKGGIKKITPELKIASGIIREITKPKYIQINFPFLEPVDHVKLQIPTYPIIVKNPMDLGTIQKRLDAGFYGSVAECEADVRLMFANCRLFNQPGTDVYEMGRKLENLFDSKWKDLKDKPAPPPQALKQKSSYDKNHRQDEDSSSSEDEAVNSLQENVFKMLQEVAKLAQKKGKKKDKEKKSSKSHTSSSSGISKPKVKSKDSPRSSHKPSKPQKSSNGGSKRKASSDEDAVQEVTYDQKRELSEKINDLSPDKLETVYEIIRSGLPNLDTQSAGQEEIELDIDSLDKSTLYKLYKFVKNSTKKPPPKRQKTVAPKKTEAKPPPPKPKERPDSSSSSDEGEETVVSTARVSEEKTSAPLTSIQISMRPSAPAAPPPARPIAQVSQATNRQVPPAVQSTRQASFVQDGPREAKKEEPSPTVVAPQVGTAHTVKRPPRPPVPPPKRRETVDIFSYVTEFEEKKKEEELEKLQKKELSVKKVIDEKVDSRKDVKHSDKIGSSAPEKIPKYDETIILPRPIVRTSKSEEMNPDWLEIHTASALINEFEDSIANDIGKLEDELHGELASEKESLILEMGKQMGSKPGSASRKKVDKKNQPSGPDTELTDKLSKAGVEIEVLLKELEHNNELNERLKAKTGVQKEKIEHLEVQMDLKTWDRVEMTSDMSRQYKSMQAEMMARINSLEASNLDLKQKLASAQAAAQEAAKEFTKIIAQKDEIIEEQNVKMSYMSTEFETMLNETLARMSRKLDAVSQSMPQTLALTGKEPSSEFNKSISANASPDLISVKITRFEKRGKKYYFVCQVRIEDRNLVLYRTYDDFYQFQIRMLETFEVKGVDRRIPYLPGPKIFVTERVCRRRVKQLDDYWQDMMHLEPRIAHCNLVRELLRERSEDKLWNDGLSTGGVEDLGSKLLAPWSKGSQKPLTPKTPQGKASNTSLVEGSVATLNDKPSIPPKQTKVANAAALERPVATPNNGAGFQKDSLRTEAQAPIQTPAVNNKALGVGFKGGGNVTVKINYNQERVIIIVDALIGLDQFLEKAHKKLKLDVGGAGLFILEDGDYIPVDEVELLKYFLDKGSTFYLR
ncbi:hypothetical protein HDU67_004356 [Dinochytrium kinnereticum]|nr:hypothetical protein HDU67_004356 [Dinochytrium kinnereticum]